MPRRAARFTAELPEPDARARRCEHPGCEAAGEFRAPRDRNNLREFRWFCLPHVRAYNASWDYYKGMGPTEIEAHLRQDASWQRPSWPLGALGSNRRFLDPERLRDPLDLLHGTPLHERRRQGRREHEVPAELRAALDLLELPWPLDPPVLKARYKELAKRYHPDATGGDRGAEERLKDINRAYSLLRRRVQPRPQPAAQQAAAAG